MPKKPLPDSKTCATCESYRPADQACGECHLMPPVRITDQDGVCGWARPTTAVDSFCRFWLRKLNS